MGLAWCDSDMGVVLPFGVVKNQESGIRNQELADLIKNERINKVIIGLPLGMKGEENANTKRVREFGEELRAQIACPVEFFDERFSSQAADRSEGGASRDEKSAMIILQSWLDKNNQ